MTKVANIPAVSLVTSGVHIKGAGPSDLQVVTFVDTPEVTKVTAGIFVTFVTFVTFKVTKVTNPDTEIFVTFVTFVTLK